jgi:hypothetical protein
MRTFCTLFDKNYLYQGVALYRSLKRVAESFKLYALCMDTIAFATIEKLKFDDLVPIRVDELLDSKISQIRERTTHGQFCWVCQPLLCEFVLDRYRPDMVTYLEADSLFFSDPEVLFRELKEKSVSLVPHNFSPGLDHSATSGQFCVQFNAFRNNREAREVLKDWKSWCFKYSKDKPRVYPGQTCLDTWPERFDCVGVIQHVGAGVAPWNIQKYTFEVRDGVPLVDGAPIVFYHYHQYGVYEDGWHLLSYYPLTREVVNFIYGSYIQELKRSETLVRTVDPTFNYRRRYKNNRNLTDLTRATTWQDIYDHLRILRARMRGSLNVFPDEYFSGSPDTEKMRARSEPDTHHHNTRT